MHTSTSSVVLMDATACSFAEDSTIFYARQQQAGRGLSLVVKLTTPHPVGNVPTSKVSTIRSDDGAKNCTDFFSRKK